MSRIEVGGRPTREELAVVLSVLARSAADPPAGGYERWRAARLEALRRTARRSR